MKKPNSLLTDIPKGMQAPTDFVEHHLHSAFFLEAEEKKKKESYYASIEKFGKVKPVVFIEKDGEKQVIDGWGYVEYARMKGIELISCYQMTNLATDEDVARIMLELQFSDHSTVREEYKIYKGAFDLFSKGQGWRSDLDANLGVGKDGDALLMEKKRLSIHDKIAEMTNASSGSRVKYILKIGDVNPSYFDNMENEKMSASTAYLKCVAEEKQKANGSVNTKKEAKQTSEKKKEKDSAAFKQHILKFDDFVDQGIKENQKKIYQTPDTIVAEDDNTFCVFSKCKICSSGMKVVLTKESLIHE